MTRPEYLDSPAEQRAWNEFTTDETDAWCDVSLEAQRMRNNANHKFWHLVQTYDPRCEYCDEKLPSDEMHECYGTRVDGMESERYEETYR